MALLNHNLIQYQYLYERPTPQAFGIGQCQVGGVEYFSDGKQWYGGAAVTLGQGAAGWILHAMQAANASTYTQAGTLVTVTSTGHNMAAATNNGRNIYLGISTGTATTGWFSNFTYVDANTFTCTAPDSKTTSGAVLSNTAETTIISVPVPAGMMGLNGSIRVSAVYQNNNSAGAKSHKIKLGGTQFVSTSATTTVTYTHIGRSITNRNSLSSQVSQNVSTTGGGGSSASAPVTAAIDTSVDTTVTLTLQLAAASDWVSLDSYIFELLPA